MRYLATGLVLLMVSCAGMGARSDVLPTIAASFNNVIAPMAVVAIGTEQDAGRITAERAIELRGYLREIGEVLDGNGSPESGAKAWVLLQPFLLEGIDSLVRRGDIGAGVGASLKEVLRMFGARMTQLAGPVAVADVPGLFLDTTQQAAVQGFVR